MKFKPLRFVCSGRYYIATIDLACINFWFQYSYMNGFNGYVYASYKDSNDDFILFCNDHSHNAIDIENQMEAHYQKIMNGLYNKLESYRME